MEKVILKAGDAEAHVYLHGAHLTYWRAACGKEIMYLSPKAIFAHEKGIRGGVPICWPQFSDRGSLQAHGFARTSQWQLKNLTSSDSSAEGVFELSAIDDKRIGGFSYTLRYIVTVGGDDLRMQLIVANNSKDGDPLTFTCALHSYFQVSDISAVRMSGGLDDCSYQDNLQQKSLVPHQPGDPPTSVIDKEIDRVYVGVKDPVYIHDGCVKIMIRSENLPDAVLWNPWIERTKKFADLPEDAYKHFVCVESGSIAEKVAVPPGQSWSGAQHVTCICDPHRNKM